MIISRKLMYMALGGLLALSLAFGAFATFAQTDDDAVPAEGDDTSPPTNRGAGDRDGRFGSRGFEGERPDLTDRQELMAEALGVTVEELQAAQDAVRVAAIEQAVADGLLTQEQADQMLSNADGWRGRGGKRGGLDRAGNNELLAEELGVSVEALEAAREEVQAARQQELIDAGVLTQEQVDMMEAQRAVRGYLDMDAISESIQAAHEAAIEQALADGVITQEQADQMLENLPTFNSENGRRGFPGGGHHGGPRGNGGRGNFGQGQNNLDQNSFFDKQTAPVSGQDA